MNQKRFASSLQQLVLPSPAAVAKYVPNAKRGYYVPDRMPLNDGVFAKYVAKGMIPPLARKLLP